MNSVSSKPKPAGTDDGFKGEGAACGTSIVKVGSQWLSGVRTYAAFEKKMPLHSRKS